MGINYVHEDEKDKLDYMVVIAYAGFDSHDDKAGDSFIEPDVWRCHVHAQTALQAIERAIWIVQISRAETMTDYFNGHPLYESQESYTKEDIEFIRQDAESRGVFKGWLDMQPTSIQVHLVEDEDTLLNMTTNNIIQMTEDTGNDAEEFLKGLDDDS
jgi:hypothetical protein